MSELRSRLMQACTLRRDGVTGVTGVTAVPVTLADTNRYKGYAGYASPVPDRNSGATPRDDDVTGPSRLIRGGRRASLPLHLPEEWQHGLERLAMKPLPAGFSEERWAMGVRWAHRIAREHGLLLFVGGWATEDLFGLHPEAPSSRYDAMGLAFTLREPCRIVMLNRERAVIRNGSGAQSVFYAKQCSSESVPAWTLFELLVPCSS